MAREITIVPYDPNWPVMYEEERKLLLNIFGSMAEQIHHFGSTSIEGMPSKPIIDIMIVTSNLDQVDARNAAMEAIGYVVKGENGIPGRRYFVRLEKSQTGNHTHHVHVYQAGNHHIMDELMFRDYLRIDHTAFEEYELVKKEAAKAHRYDPATYTEAKTACVMKIMKKAKACFCNRAIP